MSHSSVPAPSFTVCILLYLVSQNAKPRPGYASRHGRGPATPLPSCCLRLQRSLNSTLKRKALRKVVTCVVTDTCSIRRPFSPSFFAINHLSLASHPWKALPVRHSSSVGRHICYTSAATARPQIQSYLETFTSESCGTGNTVLALTFPAGKAYPGVSDHRLMLNMYCS